LANGRVVSAITPEPREGPVSPPRSLERGFSPDLCTFAAWYRASGAYIFRHLIAAKFEILSLHQSNPRNGRTSLPWDLRELGDAKSRKEKWRKERSVDARGLLHQGADPIVFRPAGGCSLPFLVEGRSLIVVRSMIFTL
jgi:hypothetical protein